MSGLLDSMLPAVDAILGIRDSIGATKKMVSIVTRLWYVDNIKTTLANAPEGFPSDVVVKLLPTPGIKDYTQSIHLREGGSVKQGDIILSGISKNLYKLGDLDGTSPAPNVQRFFLIGDKLYQVISVTEGYLTWNVQVRELSNQRRF